MIENIGQILKRLPEFAEIQDDLCKIDDPFLLRRIRNVVLAEQKKPNGGIFAGTVLTQGYWGRNFCSATITNLIQYKMLQFNG